MGGTIGPDLPPVPPNDFHYGSPTAGCLADEIALDMNLYGVNGTVCSQACSRDEECPLDASDGARATPVCAAHQPFGQKKQCVLHCNSDKDCGSNTYGGSCALVADSYKICLFAK